MTKPKKDLKKLGPEAEADFKRRSRSWKKWTDRQREFHEDNPHVAAAAAAAERQEELARIIAGRHRQIANRAVEVEKRLRDAFVLPDWLDEMLTECREEFTERELQALVYTYGYELSQREAARALGIHRETFRRRLARAEGKVKHLRGDLEGAGERERLADERLAEFAKEWDLSTEEALAKARSQGTHD